MRPWPLTIVFGLLVVGCAPTAPPLHAAAPAQLPTGYKLQDAPKYGISIGVAPGWKSASGEVVDMRDSYSQQTGETIAPGAEKGDNDLGKLLRGQEAVAQKQEAEAMAALEAKGVIIHMVNPGVRPVFGETPTYYEVKITPNPSATLEGAADSVREKVPGEEKPVAVTVPAGPCMVVVANKKMNDGGLVTTSKYILQDGKTMIEVRFVTEADPSVVRSIEKDVMNMLRIVPGKAVPPTEKSS